MKDKMTKKRKKQESKDSVSESDLERRETAAALPWGLPSRGPRPGHSSGDRPRGARGPAAPAVTIPVPSQVPCASTPGWPPGPLSADQASRQDPTRLSSNLPALPSCSGQHSLQPPGAALPPFPTRPSPSSALFFLCPGLGLQPLSSPPQGGVPHLPGSCVVPATPLSQSIVLITARNGTRIGEGRKQRPLTVRGSMAAPTYAGGDGRRELRLLCLLP